MKYELLEMRTTDTGDPIAYIAGTDVSTAVVVEWLSSHMPMREIWVRLKSVGMNKTAEVVIEALRYEIDRRDAQLSPFRDIKDGEVYRFSVDADGRFTFYLVDLDGSLPDEIAAQIKELESE